MSVRPWPDLREEDRWLVDAIEERFATSHRSFEELRARACELREQAEQSDIRGVRETTVALAERYEEAAALRRGPG
jgi:hypothetical protein